jgi:YHS domain-containing protein
VEGLLSFLLFAGLFYFMMRYGCGAHTVHGHGGGGDGEHAGHGRGGGHRDARGDTDPVCGMDVAPGQGYTKMHAGRAYRFCSRACLDKFEANPDQYAPAQGGAR